MNSTLLLTDVTCIDHAYLDQLGKVHGRSYFASFLVSGSVEEQENVVVDFSNIKKTLKRLVDEGMGAFDHKLWVDTDAVKAYEAGMGDPDSIYIETPYLSAMLPVDAVRVVPIKVLTDLEAAEDFLGSYLTEAAREIYPHVADLKVEATFNQTPHLSFSGPHAMFDYFHGLKNSSSYGCQNLLHGHTSYIQILGGKSLDVHTANYLVKDIARDLRGVGFAMAENTSVTELGATRVEYNCSRGFMTTTLKVDRRRDNGHKLVVLETETTVEYLCNYVQALYGDRIKEVGGTGFVVSEGLAKGAVCLFNKQ